MKERNPWLETEKNFRYNINTLATCPSCKEGILFIKDIAFDEKDIANGGERYFICKNCEKYEIALYRVSVPENWYSKNKEL